MISRNEFFPFSEKTQSMLLLFGNLQTPFQGYLSSSALLPHRLRHGSFLCASVQPPQWPYAKVIDRGMCQSDAFFSDGKVFRFLANVERRIGVHNNLFLYLNKPSGLRLQGKSSGRSSDMGLRKVSHNLPCFTYSH